MNRRNKNVKFEIIIYFNDFIRETNTLVNNTGTVMLSIFG